MVENPGSRADFVEIGDVQDVSLDIDLFGQEWDEVRDDRRECVV